MRLIESTVPGEVERSDAVHLLSERAVLTRAVCRELIDKAQRGDRGWRVQSALTLLLQWVDRHFPGSTDWYRNADRGLDRMVVPDARGHCGYSGTVLTVGQRSSEATMATKKPYRGIFKTQDARPSWLTLDFYADSSPLAYDHAALLAPDVHMHREWGVLTLVKVVRLKTSDVYDPGAWRPVAGPESPPWASVHGRKR